MSTTANPYPNQGSAAYQAFEMAKKGTNKEALKKFFIKVKVRPERLLRELKLEKFRGVSWNYKEDEKKGTIRLADIKGTFTPDKKEKKPVVKAKANGKAKAKAKPVVKAKTSKPVTKKATEKKPPAKEGAAKASKTEAAIQARSEAHKKTTLQLLASVEARPTIKVVSPRDLAKRASKVYHTYKELRADLQPGETATVRIEKKGDSPKLVDVTADPGDRWTLKENATAIGA